MNLASSATTDPVEDSPQRSWILERSGRTATLGGVALASFLVYAPEGPDRGIEALGAVIGSLALAVLVLVWSRRTRPYIPLAALGALLLASFGSGLDEPSRDAAGVLDQPGFISAFDLREGDCFDDDEIFTALEPEEAPGLHRVRAVPCSELHDNEIYLAFELPDSPFPGEKAMELLANQGCLDGFEAFVGRAHEDSELDFFSIFPTAQSWENADRTVHCALYRRDLARVTGSLRESGR